MSAAPPPLEIPTELPGRFAPSAAADSAPVPVSNRTSPARQNQPRTAILVSPDDGVRKALAQSLTDLRWSVREASGGAEAMMLLEDGETAAVILDSWLPDLHVSDLAGLVQDWYPHTDLLYIDGRAASATSQRAPHRNELLHAIREARDRAEQLEIPPGGVGSGLVDTQCVAESFSEDGASLAADAGTSAPAPPLDDSKVQPLPDLIGSSRSIREIAWLVRIVAPRSTTVLIEGETGTGKEVIARALHSLSPRASKPFAVLNCAAIPESLLEAELFGHTRGAFTGAVQSRMGRIEAAHGGTLLLDEIGEMPLSMQAKMLRFLESGELQRVGDNEITRVDVRLIAATHQPLEKNAAEGRFRLDLYHRLAVFPIELPPLRDRLDDIPALAEHFLCKLTNGSARKHLSMDALTRLRQHSWSGNVRELMHVLERAVILSGGRAEIGAADIRYRRSSRD